MPTLLRPPRPATTAVAMSDEPWDEHTTGPASPLAALVEAAAESGHIDRRTLGERVGLSTSALHEALHDPSSLTREQRDALARALGVEPAVVRAACDGGAPAPDARAGTLVGLLERTIAAVADDALGRRVRLSLLTTVQTAAAEAGRTLPPEAHELRARVQRGAPAWIGEGGTFVDDSTATDESALLDTVANAIRAAQRNEGGYDDLFAPLHDDALDTLLRRWTAAVRPAALGPTSLCVVTPPLFGRHLVICSADATADQRRIALRRALAHVLCGHVGELAPLSLPAPVAIARTADVFALADLVPFWQLSEWRRGARSGWRTIMARVTEIATALAGDWDDTRAADAARLRVLLFRERKL